MTSAHAEMLIRTAVDEVFNAFADPQRICEFWLDKCSGPLSKDAHVEWQFMVPGARETVVVTAFNVNERIAFTWSNGLTVDVRFHEHSQGATRVEVTVSGFTGAEAAAQAINATEGFAIVLCDLKSLLETGRSGGMVRDKAVLIAEQLADA